MRWPCGPLEIERGRRREGWSAREADALQAWCEPRALGFLAGSPVSCLVVTWAEGSAGDEGQQRALAPLIAAARGRGLLVVGWVGGKGGLGRAAGAAHAAGLTAIATESQEPAAGIDVLRFRARDLGERSQTDFVGVRDLVWPGVKVTPPQGIDAESGPTGPPWLDSNAWYARLVRALVEPKALWLGFEPPALGQPVAGAAYVQAIADSEVSGARWLVALDPHLRFDLAQGRAAALETWAGIGRALAFFRAHSEWTRYLPVGQLGVVSDYAGANEFLSFETLNLLARQGSLYRILDRRAALATGLEALDAVLYVDADRPGPELTRKLYAFAEAGGTLITPPGWEERGVRDDDARRRRFREFRYGRGRLAVASQEPSDPYVVAEDAQLLIGHRNDRLRIFNPGTGQFHYATSGDSRSGVLHALLFEPVDARTPVTVWLRQPWARGSVLRVDSPEVAKAVRTAVEPGVEFTLPPVPVYCALEVSS
jgi:hypothetical protein